MFAVYFIFSLILNAADRPILTYSQLCDKLVQDLAYIVINESYSNRIYKKQYRRKNIR